jgi:arabinose-5-phosphate isomerase
MSDQRLIFDTARRTLAIELETLQALHDSIDASFSEVVSLVQHCGGRVVITGVGKSALVAQKIAATLNSTGTPALFMHGADAIHGDLGMVQTNDIVIALSKSGETSEMRALLPLVRRLGNKIVAMVSKPESYLAMQADYVLLTPVQKEADLHNLAPTASAISQMAMGDALATSLTALRGFKPEDFAQYHPGGSLGKRLFMRLADLGCRNACPSVGPDATLEQVVVEMTTKRLGATAVVDADQKLIGIITDGDLRRALGRGVEVVRLSAKQLMSPSPRSLDDAQLAVKGLELLQKHNISQLLLVDGEGKYSGMVHIHDFVREGLE